MYRLKLLFNKLGKHRFLFIAVLLISFFQSFVLIIKALEVNYDLVMDIYIPFSAYKIDLGNIIIKILRKIIPLFFIQFILSLFYYNLREIIHKRIFAAFFCFFPALIAFPFSLGYLFSPLFSIGVITSFFSGSLTVEDVNEGWMFIFAAAGFYYLFWLFILIKSLILDS